MRKSNLRSFATLAGLTLRRLTLAGYEGTEVVQFFQETAALFEYEVRKALERVISTC